jgi:hypothetical protein
MIDRAWYRWKCVRCFRSFIQTFSRRHHDWFSSLCEEKISRRRSESCFVENRIRFEFCWNEKKSEKKEKKRDEENREEKKNEKNEKKEKKNENDEIDDDDERNNDVDI